MNGSLKTENIYGEVQVGTARVETRVEQPELKPNENFFNLRKPDDDENLIEINYAIRSDIDQLQSFDFDIVFSKQIKRIGTNYNAVDITNEVAVTSLKSADLEDISLCLKYEDNDSLGYTKVL